MVTGGWETLRRFYIKGNRVLLQLWRLAHFGWF